MVTLREPPSGAPTITAAHNLTSRSLYLAWEPPHPLTVNGEFLGYRLTYETRGGRAGPGRAVRELRSPATTEYILRDLAEFTQYAVSLAVVNPAGPGPAARVTVMTDEGVPSAPQFATVHSVTSNSAVVDWSRPGQPNGRIQGYRLYFLRGNSTDVVTIQSEDPRVDYKLTGLGKFSFEP